MNHFEVVESKLMSPGMLKATGNVWAVLEHGTPVYVAMSESEARSWLVVHKTDIAHNCSHEQMSAEREVADNIITLECQLCGMVGEMEIDLDSRITWIGQQ